MWEFDYMSNTAIQTVNFSDYSIDEDAVWVTMEQEEISETSENANLFDIFQMMGRSASGLTAFTYTPPDLDFISFTSTNIIIELDFLLFPSSMGLLYSLEINQGSLSDKLYVEMPKMGNIVIPLDDKVQMPYLIDPDLSSFEWETPVYDEDGHFLNSPVITVNGPYLTFKQAVFGIIRADIKAKGYRYTATLSFPKSHEGRQEIIGIITNQTTFNSITNVNCSVVCTYTDEDDNEQQEVLELKIPAIVEDFLSECDDGTLKTNPRCNDGQKNADKKYTTTIYYSTCTGEILDTVRGEPNGANGCDNE